MGQKRQEKLHRREKRKKQKLQRSNQQFNTVYDFSGSVTPAENGYLYKCDVCGIYEQIPEDAILAIDNIFGRKNRALPTMLCANCEKGNMIPVDQQYSHDEDIDQESRWKKLLKVFKNRRIFS